MFVKHKLAHKLIKFDFSLIFFASKLIIIKNGVIEMSTAKKIKMMLVEREMTMGRLATLLNITPPTLSIKIKRDNFSESDLKKIADVLNYEYEAVFTDKTTGKKI